MFEKVKFLSSFLSGQVNLKIKVRLSGATTVEGAIGGNPTLTFVALHEGIEQMNIMLKDFIEKHPEFTDVNFADIATRVIK